MPAPVETASGEPPPGESPNAVVPAGQCILLAHVTVYGPPVAGCPNEIQIHLPTGAGEIVILVTFEVKAMYMMLARVGLKVGVALEVAT